MRKVERVTNEILSEPAGVFRSSWAKGIQEELQIAAGFGDGGVRDERKLQNLRINADRQANGGIRVENGDRGALNDKGEHHDNWEPIDSGELHDRGGD